MFLSALLRDWLTFFPILALTVMNTESFWLHKHLRLCSQCLILRYIPNEAMLVTEQDYRKEFVTKTCGPQLHLQLEQYAMDAHL